jgi:hypothetical protein
VSFKFYLTVTLLKACMHFSSIHIPIALRSFHHPNRWLVWSQGKILCNASNTGNTVISHPICKWQSEYVHIYCWKCMDIVKTGISVIILGNATTRASIYRYFRVLGVLNSITQLIVIPVIPQKKRVLLVINTNSVPCILRSLKHVKKLKITWF